MYLSISKLARENKNIEEFQFRGKGARALEREREAIRHAGGHDLKEDAALRDPTVAPAQRGTASPADSGAATVSWRGDGEYVAVSTLEDALVEATLECVARRVVRVFTREGALHSVLEPADGVEHALAWRPSGAVLALTQRGHDDDGAPVLQVAFFERNGLRHGEFDTRLDAAAGRVAGLAWACNSEVLALQLADRVQLWTSKNYHWYLKQELVVSGADARNEVVFVRFHPEKPLHLMVGTSRAGLWVYNLAQQTATGPTVAGRDAGMVVVIDGAEAKVTPLALANVPPPMAYRDYDFDAPLCAAAVNRANDAFAVATCAGDVHVCRVSPADMRRGVQPAVATIGRALIATPDEVVKQVCFIADTTVAVLVDAPGASRVELFDVHATATHVASAELGVRAVLLKARADFAAAVAECVDGSLLEVLAAGATARVAQFPVLCHDFEVCMVSGDMGEEPVALGVSGNGKLYGNDTHLASGVTSIKATQDHLVLTNAHSQVCFVHLKNVLEPATFSFLQNQTAAAADERVRQIERGLVLVSCIPSKYSVVLQAPRGNLETICPRIMVLSGVRNFIAALDYRNAFVACRTHRIDLDLLHDYDPALFHSNVELFVKQIGRADYLDLFVSCLHEEDVTQTKYRDTLRQAPLLDLAKLSLEPRNAEPASASPRRIIFNKEDARTSSKINRICNAVLEVLSAPPYESQFLQTRVTAYACQAPPNLPGALSLISALEDEDEHEKAITHLCFLLDVNKLYDHALELYDVKMALNIAQKSQKDPKEYLPFLQNLHVQTPLRRQFLIDDHLKHYSKALGWLHELGHEAVAELDDFVVKHSLYKDALAIYRYDDQRNKHILALYAEHLVEEKKYSESGVIYEYLGSLEQALESFVLCMRWKEALAIAQSLPGKELVISTAERLSSMLVDDHKYSDAAEIELRVLGNVEEAIKLHCMSYQFDSAILLATEKNHTDLIASTVDLQLDESFGVIAELLADCTSQANSQLKRLRELRQKKEDDPYAFYGIPNDDLDTPDNVSVAASETSTTPSFFTKYTGKTSGTAKTGASRKTSKNRKREERKRAKGRKGTIYEEEYLIKSVGRLVERLDQTEADALRLIEGLVRRHKMQQAYQIQHNWGKLTVFLRENIQEIHNMSEKDRERIDDNGEIYLIDEIPAPVIRDFPKLEMLDY
ncbi:IkappaB kinase complex, IKAP component [Metschnikowia bicuspidata var. bicuspidata NRRL YB-4993]|uniref:Elongator complex protein 1 n=1 Tax=Metschnikowia bicuspidata var. bicuspidata NRRL YB-4993 TaxID=869754 RepID=A0A1A0HBM7_9ASCO|nr:IkappaB kinase complex, IKAP component [Metschnikowia bicuspidata var. bicuspidata NRRL YB-4993]OBA21416.1 IkappaB kinase complex, IKAP component [Metschnikowia bicuspidata var. bicuspidata NRRL YB-4993]